MVVLPFGCSQHALQAEVFHRPLQFVQGRLSSQGQGGRHRGEALRVPFDNAGEMVVEFLRHVEVLDLGTR